jgi:hypothetical protein
MLSLGGPKSTVLEDANIRARPCRWRPPQSLDITSRSVACNIARPASLEKLAQTEAA